MPNWASVQYAIVGSEKQIKQIADIIKKMDDAEVPLVPNGFGKLWFGCMVNELGGDWQKIYCRGSIEYYDIYDSCITLNAGCAWGELSEWRKFMLEKFDSISIFYECEEPGMEIYTTNDVDGEFYDDRFRLDTWGVDGLESECFSAFDQVQEYLDNKLDIHFNSSKQYQDYFDIKYNSDESGDCYVRLYEYKVIED